MLLNTRKRGLSAVPTIFFLIRLMRLRRATTEEFVLAILFTYLN
jgi:hypothetical protein